MSWRIDDDSAVDFPSPRATFAATTLREYATASSNVIQPMPLRSASSTWVRPRSSLSVPTSLILVLVVTVFVSNPAMAVSILKTEPGSYTELTTGSMKRDGSVAAIAWYWLPSYEG